MESDEEDDEDVGDDVSGLSEEELHRRMGVDDAEEGEPEPNERPLRL